MTSSLAFFPWVSVSETVEVGPLRLLPYERGILPGDRPKASQADIDAILGTYADQPGHPVRRATLIEYGEWRSGDDSGEWRESLFRAHVLVGFSALAKRVLFRGHTGYCNYDTYSMIVQLYEPGRANRFSFLTRRRDGGTQHLWGSDLFSFFRPHHVDTHARAELDVALLAALLSIADEVPYLVNAIEEFNAANTDSRDIPEHVEMVMSKAAFEALLRIGADVSEFVAALEAVLGDAIDRVDKDGPRAQRWRSRWPKASAVLEAWGRDFCDLRGAAAHGRRGGAQRFVWGRRQHLAFASVLFPLLVKKRLSDENVMVMSDRDVETLRRIERFLTVDPLAKEHFGADSEHPWEEIHRDVSSALLEKAVLASFRRQQHGP